MDNWDDGVDDIKNKEEEQNKRKNREEVGKRRAKTSREGRRNKTGNVAVVYTTTHSNEHRKPSRHLINAGDDAVRRRHQPAIYY